MAAAAESPAIRKLGQLFRLTEVHLWEDSYGSGGAADEGHRHRCSSGADSASFHASRTRSKPAKQTDEGYAFMEDLELANLMGSLGLPVSFSTSREKKNTINKGRKKGIKAPYEAANTPIDDAVSTGARVDDQETVAQFIIYDEHTDLHSLSRIAAHSDKASPDDVDKVLGEGSLFVKEEEAVHGTIFYTENAPEKSAEDNREMEICQSSDKMIESVKSNSSDQQNRVPGDALLLNKEPLGYNFVDTALKTSCAEICQEGRLSKCEDEIILETSSVFHDAADVDCEPCQSSVGLSLSYQHVQKSDCSSYYEHGDWKVFWDTLYNRNYFYNIQTQESTWYAPPGLEDITLYCGTYNSTELDEQGPPDTNCQMQEHEKSVNFDQSSGVLPCADNTTDCSMSEADQYVVAQQGTTCANGTEKSHEAGAGRHLDRQGEDLCNQFCDSTDIPPEDLINGRCSLVSTIDGAQHDENIESSMTYASDMYEEVATTKKKKRVRRSQSHGSCQDMAGNISNDIAKYWAQRYSLFSRFDSGIKMDEEGWFSVTPETIAKHHASRVGMGLVIDCFTGAGGNAIQFAMMCKHVIAVDIDPTKIDCAQHNATVYGVNDHVDFVVGDFIQIAPRLKGETAFLSPPWGGPDYAKVDIYDMKTMLKPCDGYSLFKLATMIASRVVMFLPRNVNLNQLAEMCLLVDPPWTVEVEKNFLNGKLKAITAYFKEQNRTD